MLSCWGTKNAHIYWPKEWWNNNNNKSGTWVSFLGEQFTKGFLASDWEKDITTEILYGVCTQILIRTGVNVILYFRRPKANAELESCAKGRARKNYVFALLPSRATLTSRSLRFRLCSPKIRQQLRLFCRLRFNMLFCCSLNFHNFFWQFFRMGIV